MDFFIKTMGHDVENNSYTVSYCIEVKPNVLRRTVATYTAEGSLSRDSNNKKLISAIQEKLGLKA